MVPQSVCTSFLFLLHCIAKCTYVFLFSSGKHRLNLLLVTWVKRGIQFVMSHNNRTFKLNEGFLKRYGYRWLWDEFVNWRDGTLLSFENLRPGVRTGIIHKMVIDNQRLKLVTNEWILRMDVTFRPGSGNWTRECERTLFKTLCDMQIEMGDDFKFDNTTMAILEKQFNYQIEPEILRRETVKWGIRWEGNTSMPNK